MIPYCVEEIRFLPLIHLKETGIAIMARFDISDAVSGFQDRGQRVIRDLLIDGGVAGFSVFTHPRDCPYKIGNLVAKMVPDDLDGEVCVLYGIVEPCCRKQIRVEVGIEARFM